MKQFWKFFFSILLCVMAFDAIAQDVELKFTGRDTYGNYVRLDNVDIENQSRNWTETLTWPDTTLLMMNLVDIAENEDQLFPFVGQNVPNPFDGVTELAVNLAEGGSLHLSVYTVSGRLLSDFIGELSTGIHRFRIQVAQPQACVVVARSGARQGSAKILNNGHGTVDRVEYLGSDGFVQRGLSVEPFGYGDQMKYRGYATISGRSAVSNPVAQAQNGSETITLVFKSTPQVTTTIVSASDVTDESATCGGNVTNDGGSTVTGRGVYWGTSHNPEVNGNRAPANGSGTGNFTVSLTGLSANTTYYVKAYATNGVGTAYGSEVSFTSGVGLPSVSTLSPSSPTDTSAICGGDVTNDGGSTVTVRGVYWGTSPNPEVNGNHTANGSGAGSFSFSLTGLTPGTTYYVKAYATNSTGTAYGEEVSFTTLVNPCPGAATLTDVDGNTYHTVQIGQQCWMKENLRTKKYADGTSISQGSEPSTTTAYWYYPNNSPSTISTYGLLYNWKAVMRNSSSSSANPSGVQGICPTGWHVPSDAEWTQLTDYVSSQSQYVCGGNSSNIAKALAATTGWDSSTATCAVGNTPSNNNATGFSALPAGYNFGTSTGVGFGVHAIFRSATKYSYNRAYCRYFSWDNAGVDGGGSGFGEDDESFENSVRCLRDDLPTVTTSTTTASSITSTSATCGGNVTSIGSSAVTERGVYWGTSPSPEVNGSRTPANGSGTGSFTVSLTGLTLGTTYYVKAYATNSAGTGYGSEVSFTTSTASTGQDGQPCPNAATLTDIDGNTYNTVQIGQQCWMKENLRTKKYADGTAISQGSEISATTAYWYYPDNSSSNMSTYGLLYNWKAVMRNSSSSSANPSGVQGICPTGWHVPSNAEWTQLTDYVSSQSRYVCGSDNTYIAKALAGTTGWSSSTNTNTCAVGNTPSGNNATGFSALPAGYYAGSYYNFGYTGYFWSATEGSGSYAYYRALYYDLAYVYRSNPYEDLGFSVRCLRD